MTEQIYPIIPNIKTGLRAFFFLRIVPDKKNAGWSQLILITLITLGLQFSWDLMHVGLHGELSLYGLQGALFTLPLMLMAAWSLACLAKQQEKILLLLIVFCALSLPYEIALQLLHWSSGKNWFSALSFRWSRHSDNFLLAWFCLAGLVVAIRILAISTWKRIFAFLIVFLFVYFPLSHIYRNQSLWVAPYDKEANEKWRKENYVLENEDIFYLQPKLLERELASIKPSHQQGIDLFFIGVAGYSDQDVFMKEIHFVSDLFKKKYATTDHSVMLINNPKTASQSPIASGTSLRLALKQVGAMMDQNKDILFLYLSSHGSKDHKFSLDFGSMQFNELDPKRLRMMLEDSGIKRRVIVVSACYSGGFIDALKNQDTLVITSAAPDKTSFGCSNEADFTYFGKAYFDDALRKTDSFIDAFSLAKPVIVARERADDYTESDPRIFVGDQIKADLSKFNLQLASQRMIKTVAAYQENKPASAYKETPAAIAAKEKSKEGGTDINRINSAKKLLTLMKYDSMVQDGIKQCRETAKTRSPENLVRTTPNYFRGITPQSKLWPDVVKAYADYYEESCDYVDGDTYLTTMGRVYSSNLTAVELSDINKFYSSPVGNKLASTNMMASLALQNELSTAMSVAGEKADAQFRKKISELATAENQPKTSATGQKRPWWRFW